MKRFFHTWRVAALGTLVVASVFVLAACGSTAAERAVGPYLVEPIAIGAGSEWELAGLLTLPRTATASNPVPAVVLVHGSGPGDMDSTVGGNRPFLDIASYLSSNGVAVIRYDKRTLTHGMRMVTELGGGLTVREETIEDAILAAQLLRADPRIDQNRIYMLGLSMGGMLAPRIHAEGGNFAGLIMLAGTPRLLSNILIEQSRAMISLTMEDGPGRTLAMTQLDMMAAQLDAILGMSREEAIAMPLQGLGGASAYYFLDMMTNPFENFVQDLAVPVLVMQGGRDFQVLADVDFAMLRELFQGRDDVTFKLYDNLNHLFMPTDATNFVEHASSVMEVVGNVDTRVLRDIVDWIFSQ